MRERHRSLSGVRTLLLAEGNFRALLESAPDAIVVVDAKGTIVIVNGQVESIFGYGRDDLIGQSIEILVPMRARGAHLEHREGYFHLPKSRPMGAGKSLSGRRRDGSEFPVEISLSPLETEHGMLVTSIIRDITARREAEERINTSLREKEVLLKEIHHRVKNNLQVTSSLLRLQSNYVQDERARKIFAESQNRIRSMALVHEKLYQSSDLSRIDFTDYVQSLAELLVRSFGIDAEQIVVKVQGGPVFLSIDSAIPCGLIANELVSNCLKHAFPGERRGSVEIAVTPISDGSFEFSVADDGIGLPVHIDINQTDTLGIELIRTLADQLSAEIEISRSKGTRFGLRFPGTKA